MFFCIFEFFCNEVNSCFFNNFLDVIVIWKSINFFLNQFFSFFQFCLSIFSIKVVISIKNHIVSSFFNNFFDFCCIVRIYEFFFYNSASFCKLNLCFTLFFNLTLSKFNSSHNIVFGNELTTCFNHYN